jgi:RepB DNA-primase from phage plasmid
MDRGFFITLQAMRRQLAAMPCDYYQIRLIHGSSRRAFPGELVGSTAQLSRDPMVRFLRLRNREGYDVFFRPWEGCLNAGYLLVDLDRAEDNIIDTMRANGHEPCAVLRTSPGHLQAWVRVSLTPLEPTLATSAARHLADLYGADRASAEGRHLGRLAGFTNQKPSRRQLSGYAPWVRLLFAQTRLATQAPSLLETAPRLFPAACPPLPTPGASGAACCLTPAAAIQIYSRWLNRLRIPQRFSPPDWSIADLWIAKELLRCRIPADQVQAVLRLGSPGFPRRHSDPDDYLRRTLARALQTKPMPFSARAFPSPLADAPAPANVHRGR